MNTCENMKKHFFLPSNDHGPDVEEPDLRPSLGWALRLFIVRGIEKRAVFRNDTGRDH